MYFYVKGQIKIWKQVKGKDKETGQSFSFFEYGVQTAEGSANVRSLSDFTGSIDKPLKLVFELKEFQDVQRLVLIRVDEISQKELDKEVANEIPVVEGVDDQEQ